MIVEFTVKILHTTLYIACMQADVNSVPWVKQFYLERRFGDQQKKQQLFFGDETFQIRHFSQMLVVKPHPPRYKCTLLKDKSDIITQFLHFHFELGAKGGNETKWTLILGCPRKWRLSNFFRRGYPRRFVRYKSRFAI